MTFFIDEDGLKMERETAAVLFATVAERDLAQLLVLSIAPRHYTLDN